MCFKYILVIFCHITHKRHPIAHPLEWGMGCHSWVQISPKFIIAIVVLCELSYHIGGLVQERSNSIANALALRLSCTEPSIYNRDISRVYSIRLSWTLKVPWDFWSWCQPFFISSFKHLKYIEKIKSNFVPITVPGNGLAPLSNMIFADTMVTTLVYITRLDLNILQSYD